MGRPSTYKPEYAAKVLECGAQGMSECEMARELGVARKTMLGWAGGNERGEVPEFAEAFQKAKDLAQSWWEEQARTNIKDKNFNPALWMKVVSCRFRADYSEKTIIEQHNMGTANDTANVSERELDRRLRQLLAKQDALQPNALHKAGADKADKASATAHGSDSVN